MCMISVARFRLGHEALSVRTWQRKRAFLPLGQHASPERAGHKEAYATNRQYGFVTTMAYGGPIPSATPRVLSGHVEKAKGSFVQFTISQNAVTGF